MIVTGFVAARIIAVNTPMSTGNPYIQLELQPTLLETPTAFTDYSVRFMKDDNPPNREFRTTQPICRIFTAVKSLHLPSTDGRLDAEGPF